MLNILLRLRNLLLVGSLGLIAITSCTMDNDEGISPLVSGADAKRATIEELQLLVAANHYEVLLADFIGGNGQATSALSWKLMW